MRFLGFLILVEGLGNIDEKAERRVWGATEWTMRLVCFLPLLVASLNA